MAGSLENRGKLRELIDKVQFSEQLKQNILHSSQVKNTWLLFLSERRKNNEFTAQNPLEEAKIIRKEEWGAGTKLRKNGVAVGQSDENDRKSAEITVKLSIPLYSPCKMCYHTT